MKKLILRYFISILALLTLKIGESQDFNTTQKLDLESRISTIDFVEIVNDNSDEAIYYYQNNWKILRQKAQQKNYILSYQLLKTPKTSDSSLEIILITTYENKDQYDKREDNFAELIKNSGGLKLLNQKKPNEFRKVVFSKEQVTHLN